jgi:hypothetical protein
MALVTRPVRVVCANATALGAGLGVTLLLNLLWTIRRKVQTLYQISRDGTRRIRSDITTKLALDYKTQGTDTVPDK